MKLYLILPHSIFMWVVTSTLWNYISTFCILSWCIGSPLPYETLCDSSAVCLYVSGHLYPIRFYMNLMQSIFYVYGHFFLTKLYMKLMHFIFIWMVTVTLWNYTWTFNILSSYIWSPVRYETLCEPSPVYLHAYGLLYAMKLYMNDPHLIFIYIVTCPLWNFIWNFGILSWCIGPPLFHETLYEPSAFYLHEFGHRYHMKYYMNLLYFSSYIWSSVS